MATPDFTVEHLRRLPLRAIVAFAARCSRRVEELARLPEADPESESLKQAVEAALRMAEGVASGATPAFVDLVVEELDASRSVAGGGLRSREAATAVSETAHAAASVWHVIRAEEPDKNKPPEIKIPEARKFLGQLSVATADIAALNAFSAALEAYEAVGYHSKEFVTAARKDYETLIRLDLGDYPEPGSAIDPSPAGPLGPL